MLTFNDMGVSLWAGCGVLAFALSRLIAAGRRDSIIVDLVAAVISSLALGAIATALDFGGWRELDWRAGSFAFFGAAFVIAGVRMISLIRRTA